MSVIGHYEIVRLLGAGGMGEVYAARDPRLGREVAVKLLPARLCRDAESLKRFEVEAHAAGALNHPNLLTVHELGTHDGMPYIVSELIAGESLREKLRDGALPVHAAIDYALQIASGLAAAHDRGIVHRDLKPENIMIGADDRVKIVDFGLAKLYQPPDVTTSTTARVETTPGSVLGTLGYISPEQLRGEPVDHRADLFAFGIVLYEMLTGRRPFHGDSAADVASAILREEPQPASSLIPLIAPGLDRLLQHALQKKREKRFQSARDMAFAIEALSQVSRPPIALAEASRRPSLRIAAIVAACAAVLAGVVGWLVKGPPHYAPALIHPITFSARDFTPSVSRDGRTMLFSSDRSGMSKIWLKQLPGGGEVAVTAGGDTLPRYSPDDSQFLFVRNEQGATSLFRMPVVGGMPSRVVNDAVSGDWLPDGKSIVFVRWTIDSTGNTTSVGIAAADGSGARIIARVPRRSLSFPSPSPDGRWIALADATPGNEQVGVTLISIDGKETKLLPRVPSLGGVMSAPDWVDDHHVVFAQLEAKTAFNTAAGSRVVIYDVDRDRASTYAQLPGVAGVVRSAHGRLYFDSTAFAERLSLVALDGSGGRRALTHGTAADRQPLFTRDGTSIVFSSNMSGNLDIWRLDLSSGALTRITDDPGDDFDPAFTPDGRILFSSDRTGHFEIWSAESDGSGARQLSHDGFDAENPAMSPDGQWVYYNGYADHAGIWRMHADGSGAERIVVDSSELPELSPDGTMIAYHRNEPKNEIQVVRIADRKSFRFATMSSRRYPSSAPGRSRWLPDSSGLLYVDGDEQGRWGVYRQPLVFGEDTKALRKPVAGFSGDAPTESLAVAPDGRSVIVSEAYPETTILSAENAGAIKR